MSEKSALPDQPKSETKVLGCGAAKGVEGGAGFRTDRKRCPPYRQGAERVARHAG
jgi:hypothetical protein